MGLTNDDGAPKELDFVIAIYVRWTGRLDVGELNLGQGEVGSASRHRIAIPRT
jgi:hypothetical protein